MDCVKQIDEGDFLFIVPSDPVPKARARITCRGSYDPQKRHVQEDRSWIYALLHEMPSYNEEFGDISSVQIKFFLPMPSTKYYKKLHGITDGVPHRTRPDLDNLMKYIFDVGNGILWRDDSNISKMVAEKFWSDDPRTELNIVFYKKIKKLPFLALSNISKTP